MRNLPRKLALPTTIAIFCALMGLNAYIASTNLKLIRTNAAQRTDASEVHADIAAVEMDLQAIETGQRGYLLTGDDSYLAPYTTATAKLPGDLSTLRARLAARPAEERALEGEVEAVAKSKIADADETIRLRQKGYRHRAFLLVDSNRGQQLMGKARSLLDRLAGIESRNVAQYDAEVSESVRRALAQSALASVILLVLTVVTLMAFHQQRKRLEAAHATQAKELGDARQRSERFTSTISTALASTRQMRASAESLLNSYDGFLPRQGQERVEAIHDASCEVSHLLADLLGHRAPENLEAVPPRPVELRAETEPPRSQTA